MRSRVGELEEEFGKIKQEMKRVTKSHSSLSSPRMVARKIGCKLLPRSSDAEPDTIDSTGPTPRASIEQPRSSRHSRHRKSFSLFWESKKGVKDCKIEKPYNPKGNTDSTERVTVSSALYSRYNYKRHCSFFPSSWSIFQGFFFPSASGRGYFLSNFLRGSFMMRIKMKMSYAPVQIWTCRYTTPDFEWSCHTSCIYHRKKMYLSH